LIACFFTSVPADLLAPLGLSVTLAFAATAPYAAIVIARRVLGRKKSSRWVMWWPAIYSELAPGATVTSALSFVSRDVIHRCRRWTVTAHSAPTAWRGL